MNELAFLVGLHFHSLTRRESDWGLAFDDSVQLTIECLWRLIVSGRILVTSKDHGQQFGLSAPLDAAMEVDHRLSLTTVNAVELRTGTLDLELRFSTGPVLQIIPDSGGYESWSLASGDALFVAVGGGELAVFRNNSSGTS